MTTDRVCLALEAGRFWGCFGATRREGALRVRARLGATGLRSASVMLVQELSSRCVVGAVFDGAESSWWLVKRSTTSMGSEQSGHLI